MIDNATIQPEAITGNSKLSASNKNSFAAKYEISRRTVDNLIARGLPILKLSERQVRIPHPDADEWMRQKFFTQRRAA
jgi:hypothetical protein